MVAAIEQSKTITLARLLFSLGIRHVGEESANELAHYIESEKSGTHLKIAELVQIGTTMTPEKIQEIEGFGAKVAKEVCDWFHQEKNLHFLEKLDRVGVELPENINDKEQKLEGKSFVVTGTLASLSRDEAKNKIRELGGKVKSSVNAKLDYLVCGEKPGGKFKKAQKLNVPILKEEEFLKMVK